MRLSSVGTRKFVQTAAVIAALACPSHIVIAEEEATKLTVQSVQSAEFTSIAKDKLVLAVSPDYPKLAIRVFENQKLPNSQVIISNDIPGKKAAMYLNGKLFNFFHPVEQRRYDVFGPQDLGTILAWLEIFQRDPNHEAFSR